MTQLIGPTRVVIRSCSYAVEADTKASATGSVEELGVHILVKVLFVFAGLIGSMPGMADDGLSIAGTYTKNQPCRGDGSDPPDALVTITRDAIDSTLGSCAILDANRNGKAISMQIQCKVPGDQIILGEVTFTQRDANVLDFDDQDHTSPAVLYKCGTASASRQ